MDWELCWMFWVVLPTVWAGMGPGCIIYLAALVQIPTEYYEAADVDGAGMFTKLKNITLPFLKPLLIINFVGACVGARGARVRQVVNELRGEKIDIVPFSDDEIEFVAKALQPARVREVRIHRDLGTAEVIVPDFQLSLAIGKEGQNARLAHRLTGLRIDIRSETEDAQADYQPYEEGADYADGEWVVDPESGEQMWQPADGSAPLSLEDWNKLTDAAAGDEAAGEATADEAAGEESPSAEASGDEATDTAEVDASASTEDGGAAEQAAEVEPDESNEAISDEAADADEAT